MYLILTLNKSVFNNGNGTWTIGTDSLGKVFQQVLEHLHHNEEHDPQDEFAVLFIKVAP